MPTPFLPSGSSRPDGRAPPPYAPVTFCQGSAPGSHLQSSERRHRSARAAARHVGHPPASIGRTVKSSWPVPGRSDRTRSQGRDAAVLYATRVLGMSLTEVASSPTTTGHSGPAGSPSTAWWPDVDPNALQPIRPGTSRATCQVRRRRPSCPSELTWSGFGYPTTKRVEILPCPMMRNGSGSSRRSSTTTGATRDRSPAHPPRRARRLRLGFFCITTRGARMFAAAASRAEALSPSSGARKSTHAGGPRYPVRGTELK